MFTYNDYIVNLFRDKDPDANCRNITIQVTDDCCLKCSYCYQIHKGHHYMTPETARKIVDLMFKLYDEDRSRCVINKHTKGIIFDFIGGEPFMNVEAMDAATEYFISECIRRNHPWLNYFSISISSNGMLYFEPKVQEYLKKYKDFISLTISIDGPKVLHDTCRVDAEGNGSFDRAVKAQDHWLAWTNRCDFTTKVTVAPENLPYLDTIFDFFLSRDVINIFANPIYEHKWTEEEAGLYYHQLINLADKLLEDKHISSNSSLFFETKGKPLPLKENNNWCGGTGMMLAFDYNGLAYPCLRYMPSSLGPDIPPITVGDCNDIYNTEKDKATYEYLDNITRTSQSSDECINCHVASGCGWCSAWNYQHCGSVNKRCMNICWMHRAEALANTYYWNHYYIDHNISKRFPVYLSRDIATKIISNEEYDSLLQLSFE